LSRSILFLLPPGFIDGGRRAFCPECAEMWGFLHYFPAIREAVDIRYEGIGHPRAGLVALLGEGRWNCPTLVLAADAPDPDHPDMKLANGRRYIDSARGVARYFAGLYGTPVPRSSA
jgi:hypothetical protein